MLKSIVGYVDICVHTKSVEYFINECRKRNIVLRNTIRQPPEYQKRPAKIETQVKAHDVAELIRVAKKCKCRLHIKKKHGLPFFLNRHKKRIALPIGILLAIVFTVATASRVWMIDIIGCNTVKEDTVSHILTDLGVVAGCQLSAEKIAELPQLIKEHDDNICWVGVSLSGVRLNVSIEEEKKPFQSDLFVNAGNNLYAKKSGLVKRIIATSGEAYVNVGDVVMAGDLLISGDVIINDVIVRGTARGLVDAEVIYTFTHKTGTTLLKKMRSGNKQTVNAMIINDKLYFNTSFSEYEIERLRKKTFINSCVPIEIYECACYEIIETEVNCTTAELEEYAKAEAEKAKLAGLPTDCLIISEKYDTEVLEDGSVCVIISIVAEENIAKVTE